MFTGLIEEVGSVIAAQASDRGTQLQIAAPRIAKKIRAGDSLAVNGCCLTLSSHSDDQLTFDLIAETIDRTNLSILRPDTPVNLERALSANGRIGGHFVQGHIDCTARILAFEERVGDHRLEVQLPAEFAHYVVSKGSIAIDGISLTVAEVLPKSFVVWIVPYTKTHTNLDRAKAGDLLNLEFEILAKYVERMLSRPKSDDL
jgi:riboflavin synthase